MPEGHTLRRLALELTAAFGGRQVRAASPQGRFEDSAALIDGQTLELADSWGKHLVVTFPGERFVHVHLGLYGTMPVLELPDGVEIPAPVGQVRLRLAASGDGRPTAYADLRGPTACELLTAPQVEVLLARSGPDPLRPESDPDLAWQRIRRSRAPIGALLMDQSVLAGVGNVYRAEILFRHRMHPLRPGNTLRSRQWQAMWDDLAELMQDGVRHGWIDTVRPEHRTKASGGEVYVYRRHGQPCLVCGRAVRTEVLAGRNLFWCSRCQPAFRSRALG